MPSVSSRNPLYAALKKERRLFRSNEVIDLFSNVSERRVEALAATVAQYIQENLPAAFEQRQGLADYRTNPYVLMTSASVMKLNDPDRFADLLFSSKLHMALETSFGKSVERAFVEHYPIDSKQKWATPPEKLAEFHALEGLGREQRARLRTGSLWREVDKSVVVGSRRYITLIKSGPNTINDTQVQAMARAIIDHHRAWTQQTRDRYGLRELDVVVGLTYGTNRTTNNKENQILVKLLEHGFVEEDRSRAPGVLVDGATRSTRLYRRVGADFWAFIGNPEEPHAARFVFLEVLLALAKALATGLEGTQLEDRINRKMKDLSAALGRLRFPKNSLPQWVRKDFGDDELFWFATAMTAYYDEGI